MGRGRHLLKRNWLSPRQFSRAAFSGTAHFLVPHTHTCVRVCVQVPMHIQTLYIMALLFHVVPGDRPYQTGAGPYGTTALDGGADPVGLLLLKQN